MPQLSPAHTTYAAATRDTRTDALTGARAATRDLLILQALATGEGFAASLEPEDALLMVDEIRGRYDLPVAA